jgi:hypothetical protein
MERWITPSSPYGAVSSQEYRSETRVRVQIPHVRSYLPLDDLGATVFFQLVSAPYVRGTIMLTSNKSYGEWESIFGNDPIIAIAILDRLLHHSTAITIRRESYRLRERKKASLLRRRLRAWNQQRRRARHAAPRRTRDDCEHLNGWGIFNRHYAEISTGVGRIRLKLSRSLSLGRP